MLPYTLGRDSVAQYMIFNDVRHAGRGGYFDNPLSVSAIIDTMGFKVPPLQR